MLAEAKREAERIVKEARERQERADLRAGGHQAGRARRRGHHRGRPRPRARDPPRRRGLRRRDPQHARGQPLEVHRRRPARPRAAAGQGTRVGREAALGRGRGGRGHAAPHCRASAQWPHRRVRVGPATAARSRSSTPTSRRWRSTRSPTPRTPGCCTAAASRGDLARRRAARAATRAARKAPIGLGEAVATTAGDMPSRWVIHAATMELGGPTSADIIRRATAATLARPRSSAPARWRSSRSGPGGGLPARGSGGDRGRGGPAPPRGRQRGWSASSSPCTATAARARVRRRPWTQIVRRGRQPSLMRREAWPRRTASPPDEHHRAARRRLGGQRPHRGPCGRLARDHPDARRLRGARPRRQGGHRRAPRRPHPRRVGRRRPRSGPGRRAHGRAAARPGARRPRATGGRAAPCRGPAQPTPAFVEHCSRPGAVALRVTRLRGRSRARCAT